MEEYASNSHKSRAEIAKQDRKVEKVISGTVKTKKKTGLNKVKNIFISGDASNIKEYILMDVLIPNVKKAISEIVTNGIEIMLYGETGRKKNSNASRISYRDYYPKEGRQTRDGGYDCNDIILETRGEAEDVLSRMDEIMDAYGNVSVADFYDLVGVTGNFTDNKYGWTNIRSANVIRVRDGYMIKLPKAKVL